MKQVATEEEAQQLCKEWNESNKPETFSHKADYIEVVKTTKE